MGLLSVDTGREEFLKLRVPQNFFRLAKLLLDAGHMNEALSWEFNAGLIPLFRKDNLWPFTPAQVAVPRVSFDTIGCCTEALALINIFAALGGYSGAAPPTV